MGCAPPQELLNKWNKREAQLIAEHPGAVPAVAYPPLVQSAYVGTTASLASNVATTIANEGARTIPPREHGGNCDIKNLSKGSRVYFPVYVDGAKFSIGDLHFSQGDGELTFCGAIEMVSLSRIVPRWYSPGVIGGNSYVKVHPHQRRDEEIEHGFADLFTVGCGSQVCYSSDFPRDFRR